jgi:hypothetical protein
VILEVTRLIVDGLLGCGVAVVEAASSVLDSATVPVDTAAVVVVLCVVELGKEHGPGGRAVGDWEVAFRSGVAVEFPETVTVMVVAVVAQA